MVMYFFDMMCCSYLFFLIYCSLCVTGYSQMSQTLGFGDSTPRLSEIKDSRDDGISYEANRAMIRLYLKDTYPGKRLEDFSLAGSQELKLEYEDTSQSKKNEAFLQVFENLELSTESTWDVDIKGSCGYRANMTLLSNVLHRLPSLTSLHWRNEKLIPVEITRFLEANHPRCRLYYSLPLWSRRWDEIQDLTIEDGSQQSKFLELMDAADPARGLPRESILNSTILHSLKVDVVNGGRYPAPWRMDLILRILTTCPNIKKLDITVKRAGGCVVFPTNDPYAFDFTSTNGTIAPLESLAIDGYRFQSKANGQDWKEWEADHPERYILKMPWKYMPDSIINYIGYPKIQSLGGLENFVLQRGTSALKPGTKTNLDIWLERMDWTNLHTFKITNPCSVTLAKLGRDTLPSLRNVEFSGYNGNHHAILDFLGSISASLESIHFDGISFCSMNEVVTTVVEHHGSSLRTVVLKHWTPDDHYHTAVYSRSRNRRSYRFPSSSFLNVTHLIHLRDNMPGLVALDLDIEVTEEWNYEILDTLASFPELQQLTLRFEEQFEDSDEMDDMDGYGYERYWDDSSYRRNENQLTLMMGLKTYLTRKKFGKEFEKLEIWVGSEPVKDIGELC
jgi:hypothetical protein